MKTINAALLPLTAFLLFNSRFRRGFENAGMGFRRERSEKIFEWLAQEVITPTRKQWERR